MLGTHTNYVRDSFEGSRSGLRKKGMKQNKVDSSDRLPCIIQGHRYLGTLLP